MKPALCGLKFFLNDLNLALQGLKSAISGLKSAHSDPRFALSSLELLPCTYSITAMEQGNVYLAITSGYNFGMEYL